MKEKLLEIQKEAKDPHLETMFVVADFAKLRSIQEYQDVVASKLKGLDIGVLVLNAGTG
eukprot:CAMPEP_0168619300 /NCGR_PEP_ID=MMETSP0449_2-20121227/6527_1 /TAXON_ID=1082188 /ORGANISM="Strombidium rassoulzadegani, Strain ras09" /LENGTH=58 /DNA_ID=CAMNT_0008660223 /DNA_START=312 /DNA_END=488 /DNA_ORIENTATION=-